MKKHFLVGAALFLSAATASIAIAAASENGFLAISRHAWNATFETGRHGDRPVLLASASRKHDHHADRHAKRDRRHHDDDDDDDDDGGSRVFPQNGPANPQAPVPNNGLFNGNGRPKVQVQ